MCYIDFYFVWGLTLAIMNGRNSGASVFAFYFGFIRNKKIPDQKKIFLTCVLILEAEELKIKIARPVSSGYEN